MNTVKLKCTAVEAGISLPQLSRQYNIFGCEATTYNKVHGKSPFTVPEIIKTVRALKLSKDQVIEIFFDELLADWSSNDNSIKQNG